ncbi:MAG: bifunctional diaminohydroxyphosphoribosylaminopyrimidine deaminase/5-amino-6-(5-phosphoribosylamino)uracil reductase RibD [Candidatus Omnitrophota bacterium]|nr:bifunctional diaminohydroxyphosphoribosylaminopyrimidine deaminase/5-amino-6-(5-phosphoribosylamino)uracil reductase RibD [Candidatus Omnitrophota bacterium]
MTNDERFMDRALSLALKGRGHVSPNPLVGALVVKAGKIIGEGYHKKAGRPHAEITALNQAGKQAKGATLYITLEPCSSFGRTPPCTGAIIKSRVKRAVIAVKDKNPLNKGRGINLLKRNGIEVKTGVLKEKAEKINQPFFKFITKHLPFVTVKIAQTIDGKIATVCGSSKWITGPAARAYSHRLRSQVDAILVGIDTVLKDDPLLTALSPPHPVKIIVDSKLRLPLDAKLLSKKSPAQTIVVVTRQTAKSKIKVLRRKNVKVIVIRSKFKMVDLRSLMKKLAGLNITHVLIEGGGRVIASALEAGLADRFLVFVAPKIIGGKNALTSVEGIGIRNIKRAIKLKGIEIKRFGDDILVEGYPVYNTKKRQKKVNEL